MIPTGAMIAVTSMVDLLIGDRSPLAIDLKAEPDDRRESGIGRGALAGELDFFFRDPERTRGCKVGIQAQPHPCWAWIAMEITSLVLRSNLARRMVLFSCR